MAYAVPATHKLNKPILQALDASSATAVHDVGYTVRSTDGKEFEYVYMQSSGVTCYPGRPLGWLDTTGDYVVIPDVSDLVKNEGNSAFAGVATMQNIDVNAAYIWMQTKGLVDGALVSTTVAVGEALCLGTTGDCFDDARSFNSSLNDSTFRVVAIAMTAAAAGTTGLHSTASIMLL